MDAPTRSALESTAKRYFDMTVRGDSASLQQNSIASLASNFAGIEAAVKDNQSNLSGAQATPRSPFLLKVEGNEPLARAEFLCGVFGPSGQTADSAEFVIPNLPPGSYGVVILDVSSAKAPYTLSFVLQQQGNDWKLGGMYLRQAEISGHNSQWFADRAREFKSKGQLNNAWFYFLEARDLVVPVPFMNILASDKLYDEMQALKRPELTPSDLSAGGKTYKLTDISATSVGKDLDLVVRYQAADISNTALTFQANVAVMKALVAKYPEFRTAFDGVVARAVDPTGKDYGTLLPMKQVE